MTKRIPPRNQPAHPQPQRGNGHLLVQQQLRVGPLPDSEELARYDEIVPGAAERIIAMAEKEQAFAHEQSKKNRGIRWYSMVSGSVIVVLAIGLASFMVYKDADNVQYVVGAIAVLVGVAVTGRLILNKPKG